MSHSMTTELEEAQQAYREAARDFAQAELAPHAARWDAEGIFPREAIAKAGELGFCGLYMDPEVGGSGLSRLDAAVVIEELANVDPSTAAYISIHNMASWMVSRWGQPALRDAWGTDLSSGSKLASYCLTEPGAGSDAASLKTTAVRDGDFYVLNGSKAFISGAGATELLVVMARTGGAGAGGVSAIAVPADLPGISFGRKEEKMGWNSQPTRGITFENVRVPVSHLLGEEGGGFKLAMKGLDGGRINIAACSLGGAQEAYSRAVAHVRDREAFGGALIDEPTIRFTLAEMATELEASRLLLWRAAAALDAKEPDHVELCAMAKLFVTDRCFDIADRSLQLFGGYGYLSEYGIEKIVRDLRVHRILEGTNEIMRVVVGRAVAARGLGA